MKCFTDAILLSAYLPRIGDISTFLALDPLNPPPYMEIDDGMSSGPGFC